MKTRYAATAFAVIAALSLTGCSNDKKTDPSLNTRSATATTSSKAPTSSNSTKPEEHIDYNEHPHGDSGNNTEPSTNTPRDNKTSPQGGSSQHHNSDNGGSPQVGGNHEGSNQPNPPAPGPATPDNKPDDKPAPETQTPTTYAIPTRVNPEGHYRPDYYCQEYLSRTNDTGTGEALICDYRDAARTDLRWRVVN